jgi:hypothetical protein
MQVSSKILFFIKRKKAGQSEIVFGLSASEGGSLLGQMLQPSSYTLGDLSQSLKKGMGLLFVEDLEQVRI